MSQFKSIDATGSTTTLVATSLSMLNGIDAFGDCLSIAIHDCATTGDVAAGNRVWFSKAQFPQGYIQQFSGVLFKKGMVVVATGTDPVNSEYQINIEWE